jgi:hypothetical protein
MSSKPEIIDLTSSSPSTSSSEEDLPPYPWELDDSEYEREMERRWNAHERGEPSHVPIPAERQLVSPFIFTSDEDSSEDEDEDPTFLPPSTPERSQPRPRKRNPSLPTSQNVVLGLPAPKSGHSFQGHKGKSKEAEVVGKGKGKME